MQIIIHFWSHTSLVTLLVYSSASARRTAPRSLDVLKNGDIARNRIFVCLFSGIQDSDDARPTPSFPLYKLTFLMHANEYARSCFVSGQPDLFHPIKALESCNRPRIPHDSWAIYYEVFSELFQRVLGNKGKCLFHFKEHGNTGKYFKGTKLVLGKGEHEYVENYF